MIQLSIQDILNFITTNQNFPKQANRPLHNPGLTVKSTFLAYHLFFARRRLMKQLIGCVLHILTIIFSVFKLIIKLRKMEEFVGEDHTERRRLNEHQQDPFMVVHGFRHLIAKQRRKVLRKANIQRKKMLIQSPTLTDTLYGAEESHKNEKYFDDNLWDVIYAEESNKYKYQLSFAELIVQSHQNSHQGEQSSQKSQNTTSPAETSIMKRKLFAEDFVPFCYLGKQF